MTGHDELCAVCTCVPDEFGHEMECVLYACQCDLIARVRADERDKAAGRVEPMMHGLLGHKVLAAIRGDR